MFLDWTNWTFWVTALALIAFGFNLRVIYEQLDYAEIRERRRPTPEIEWNGEMIGDLRRRSSDA
jgi:hypothetical protein